MKLSLKPLAFVISVLLSVVSSNAGATAASPSKNIQLKNDLLVGSKIYLRYDDVVQVGLPIGGPDDEGYCAIHDTDFNGSYQYDQFSKTRVLQAGSILIFQGYENTHRRVRAGLEVVDQWAVYASERGYVKVGCSITTNADESAPYMLNAPYLKSIGMELL